MMSAVYMLKAKTLWYVTFVVFLICKGSCCFQMCICQQMDQLLIKNCQSTPSDGGGCGGCGSIDKVYCTLLRCALKSLRYPLKEIKNPLGISLVFLHDLNWSGRKTWIWSGQCEKFHPGHLYRLVNCQLRDLIHYLKQDTASSTLPTKFCPSWI